MAAMAVGSTVTRQRKPAFSPLRHGDRITSFALTNVAEAYGLRLPWLKDSDGDGFPDVIDPEPNRRGYRDGVK